MKLAVNYSDVLLSLFEQDFNLAVDYIKVPTRPFPESLDQFVRGSRWRKLLPHLAQPGVLSLGQPDPEKRFDWDLLRQICRETSPPYLSTHLEVKVDFFPQFAAQQHRDDPGLRAAVLARFGAAVGQLRKELDIPIVLENFPYYTWWVHYRVGSEPGFIRELCDRGECGFLLDIAHARCSAGYMGMELMDYIRLLPLDRLQEIHLAGSQLRPEGRRDSHTVPDDTDYRTLEYLLDSCQPEIVTIEYGGLPDRILNIRQEYEPISRNDPAELAEIIARTRSLLTEKQTSAN